MLQSWSFPQVGSVTEVSVHMDPEKNGQAELDLARRDKANKVVSGIGSLREFTGSHLIKLPI